LATKDKKPASKKAQSTTKVTRIKATDTAKPTKKVVVSKKAEKVEKPAKKTSTRANPFTASIGYFKGAWYELRQVRWPNRKATWSLTAAVMAFTAFFVVLILLLDALFKYLFELILG
jgi:preprotein translocase subunit SecE